VGSGAIDIKTPPRIDKFASIQLVDDTTEMIVISQFGKIILSEDPKRSVRCCNKKILLVLSQCRS